MSWCQLFLNEVDSSPASSCPVSQIGDKQIIQAETLEMALQMARPQIHVLDDKLVCHCQQPSNERTTAWQHENIVIKNAEWGENRVLVGRYFTVD